jgi:hypothetical protein
MMHPLEKLSRDSSTAPESNRAAPAPETINRAGIYLRFTIYD